MAHLIIILSGLFFISSVEAFDLCDFYPDHPLCVVPEGPVISISPSNEYGSLRIGTSEQQFCATVTDNNDTGLAASVQWTSDKLGVLGSGECLNVLLGYGNAQTITASVGDSDGNIGTKSQIVIPGFGSSKPIVLIDDPGNSTTFNSGAIIDFSGRAFECCGSTKLYNDIRHAIVWESDVDGYLGDGSDISTSLSVGQHFVRARVTDAKGRKDITAVKVTITP